MSRPSPSVLCTPSLGLAEKHLGSKSPASPQPHTNGAHYATIYRKKTPGLPRDNPRPPGVPASQSPGSPPAPHSSFLPAPAASPRGGIFQFQAVFSPHQRGANAAARCALIGQALGRSSRRRPARLLRAGARRGRRLLAVPLEGVEARRRHAQPQGQPQCLLFLRAGEDSRTAPARPAGGPRG